MHLLRTGRINDRISVIRTGIVNCFLYHHDGSTIMIDTGCGVHMLVRELEKLNVSPEDVSAVFLTHSDFDHVGGLCLFDKAKIYLSFAEECLIDGTKARLLFQHNKPINGDYQLLSDGEEIKVGSITVKAILSSGHTLGSVSFLIDQSTLFVGDTFAINRKGLVYPLLFPNMDRKMQKKSISRLAKIPDVEIALTAHDGFTTAFDQAIRQWKKET